MPGENLVCKMPVILIKAVTVSGGDHEQHDLYQCPLYKTRQRCSSYTWLLGQIIVFEVEQFI